MHTTENIHLTQPVAHCEAWEAERALVPQELTRGTPITSSGYFGCVIRRYHGNMWEIRLPGGECCVDRGDFTVFASREEAIQSLTAATA